MKIFFKFLLLHFVLLNSVVASVKYNDEVSALVGMSMISYAENPKTIEGVNVAEPANGSFSTIAMSLQYNFWGDYKKNYYLSTCFPLISSPQLYLNVGFGIEYYFSDIGIKTELYSSGSSLFLVPKLRYFAGAELGPGYIVYNTVDSTKTDVIFEIGVTGGVGYTFNNSWAGKFKLKVMKGTGVVTSSMNISALFGATYFID